MSGRPVRVKPQTLGRVANEIVEVLRGAALQRLEAGRGPVTHLVLVVSVDRVNEWLGSLGLDPVDQEMQRGPRSLVVPGSGRVRIPPRPTPTETGGGE